VALCAYQGELLDCVHLRKHHQTFEGKTWSGSVSEVDPAFVEALRAVIADLQWTGGAELEFVRAPDDTLHLIDWNSRFPAWIHAASFAGHNLPAQLAQAAGYGTAVRPAFQSRQFTRVVLEIPVRGTHPLPAVRPAIDDWHVSSKHPSGMPQLAERLGGAWADRAKRERPAGPVPAALRQDLDGAMVDTLPTPRRVLLARTARDRFASVEGALASAPARGPRLNFGYSVKTNPHPSLLGLADGAGMLAEVISAAELRRALATGFPAERIILNGPAQRWPDGAAHEGELMAAFADSPQSFARWMQDGPPRARYLGMRLRPVTIASRFGTAFDDPKRFAEVLALLRSVPADQEIGAHFHFASDVLGPSRWREVFDGVVHWVAAIEQGTGRTVRCLDVGGGWFPDDFDRALLPWLPQLMETAHRMLPGLRDFVVEPGKAMAQPSMALVTTVLEVRRRDEGGSEAVVDAAISDLPMAPFYPHRLYGRGARGEWRAIAGGEDRLVGRICMETDILASDIALPDGLEPGDRLVIADAGAYDASMAYNFGRGVLEDACD
jgi:diaminopimelate decarboxylase